MDDDRRKWLPPLQQAVRNAFSLHWAMKNPFDWDNYVAFFFDNASAAANQDSRAFWRTKGFPLYKRPFGCAPGDGSTPQCCSNYNQQKKKACENYGKRMGDWSGVSTLLPGRGPPRPLYLWSVLVLLLMVVPAIATRGVCHALPSVPVALDC